MSFIKIIAEQFYPLNTTISSDNALINTLKNFQFSFITILWWPTTFNYAAVESSISFSHIADNQCSTWKFDNPVIQKKRLSVLFPPYKWD